MLFRQRRKNGAWSKPKAVTLTPLEAEHMVNADDREILSLLIGAGHTWTYGGMYDASYQRLSRYVLNGPLEDRVLPLLARSGRGHLDRIGEEHGLFPIGWDDGPAWRFDLEIAVDEKHDGLVLNGGFVRGRERLALRDPALLLGRGFLFTRTSMARLELDGGFAWLARLRSVGPITIPRSESGALLETLARSGLHPRSLPAELRYEVFDGDPRPRVRVNRPERQNPYALRQDLRATVLFDYDGVTVDAPPGATAYDAERRRLVRRNRAAEQTSIDRLHQLGFRYTWSHFESRQVLGISPDQFPRVVHTLVKEGWRVEADDGSRVGTRRGPWPRPGFRAVDLAGVPSRGEVDAASKAHVSEQLRQRGLIVLDISEKHESMKLESVFQRFKSVKMRPLAIFSRQFATLIASGMPMLRSLYTLEDQTEDERLKNASSRCARTSRRAARSPPRWSRSRRVFTRSTARWCRRARAPVASRRRTTRSRPSSRSLDALKRQIRSAMMYPARSSSRWRAMLIVWGRLHRPDLRRHLRGDLRRPAGRVLGAAADDADHRRNVRLSSRARGSSCSRSWRLTAYGFFRWKTTEIGQRGSGTGSS